jgi:hypothetical protein
MNILMNNIINDIIRYLSRLIKSQRTSLWRNLKRNITVVQEDDCWIFKWTFSCSQSKLETRIYWSTNNSDRYETSQQHNTLVWCSTKYLIRGNKQNHTRSKVKYVYFFMKGFKDVYIVRFLFLYYLSLSSDSCKLRYFADKYFLAKIECWSKLLMDLSIHHLRYMFDFWF